MSGDQSSTAGSSNVTSSENNVADIKPSLNLPDVPAVNSEIPNQAANVVTTEELSKSLQEYGSTLVSCFCSASS